MMLAKPIRHTTGATRTRRMLKMSGSKCAGDDDGPAISANPMTTTAMPAASRMKLVLSNANFSLSTFYIKLLMVKQSVTGQIRYNAPAFMRKYLLTAIQAHDVVTSTPPANTAPDTANKASGVTTCTSAGS